MRKGTRLGVSIGKLLRAFLERCTYRYSREENGDELTLKIKVMIERNYSYYSNVNSI